MSGEFKITNFFSPFKNGEKLPNKNIGKEKLSESSSSKNPHSDHDKFHSTVLLGNGKSVPSRTSSVNGEKSPNDTENKIPRKPRIGFFSP